jgi:ABC-type sulfate transport system permease component
VPFKTEVASVRIYGLIESDNLPSAAATSLMLFLITLFALGIFSTLRRRFVLKESA